MSEAAPFPTIVSRLTAQLSEADRRIAALEADLARTQEVCRDITARAEKLAAEVRQWRMCVFQDENKPFDWKSEGK